MYKFEIKMNTEEKDNNKNDPPAPEVLKPQSDDASAMNPEAAKAIAKAKAARRLARHATYKPSHKATFIGLGVVLVIIALNVGIILFVMNGQSDTESGNGSSKEVTISSDVLDKLGVNNATVGNSSTELIVGPNAKFKGKVTVGSDINVAGQLNLNGKLSAADSSIVKLQAGNASLGQLEVNGNGTVTNMNVRQALIVAGSSTLQGPVTVTQLMTVNNNLNVTGSMSVGGTLSARTFQASNLVSDTTLTVGGHIITRGISPTATPGNALGNNGTISISGNDASGTVAANIGVNAVAGIIAYVTFHQAYSGTPHVVVTAVGSGIVGVYINRSANGFSIGVTNPIPFGGHAFDYIVMQ